MVAAEGLEPCADVSQQQTEPAQKYTKSKQNSALDDSVKQSDQHKPDRSVHLSDSSLHLKRVPGSTRFLTTWRR